MDSTAGVSIADPGSLLQWLAAEWASVRLRDMDEVGARRSALEAVAREWIEHV